MPPITNKDAEPYEHAQRSHHENEDAELNFAGAGNVVNKECTDKHVRAISAHCL
jgi:hypothetical protein